MSARCGACGAPLESVEGVLVDARSGDNGGTYDICPERYDEATDTQGGHTIWRPRLGLPEEEIPALDVLLAENPDRLDLVEFGYPRRAETEIPAWDADSPTTSCFHMGHDIWRTRCREEGCPKFVDSIGAVPRYASIGRHEVQAHGLIVPGLNVGLMQTEVTV